MKRLSLCLLSFAIAVTVSAQVVINVNNTLYNTGGSFFPVMGALPSNNASKLELSKGSPYFLDLWAPAILVTESGTLYKDVMVKVDLFENHILFQDSAGNEMIVGTPLREVRINPNVPGKMSHFIHGSILPNQKPGWYQLLVNDSISLIKGVKKAIEQHTSYGSAPEYTMVSSNTYIVYHQNKDYEVKKPADFISILPQFTKELEAEAKILNKVKNKDEQLALMTKRTNILLKKK